MPTRAGSYTHGFSFPEYIQIPNIYIHGFWSIFIFIFTLFSVLKKLYRNLIISDIRDFDEFETEFHDILHTVNSFIVFSEKYFNSSQNIMYTK